ncbi:MAG: PDDEXK nuclease domain-containing protein [Treponema sp.]|uniref:PDDEXK nuclease domain-containing protein n=1 Tax=Treponema sp. TaxID=166 RepID=UPI00298D982C|nr:PDDEXK nuclease domain-containing protein [Treponema sp.]MCQ2602078.1 PDDEXK nuclease domain-containing protein [Treponema sp.]
MKNEFVKTNDESFLTLYKSISSILKNARENAYKAVNFAMVTSYWSIGKLIVEDEQNGNARAEYGKAVLEQLSEKLTAEFGKGFDSSNLRYMRLFYNTFPICDTLRHELSWSHYRMLLRVKDEKARNWYMNEAADQTWSTRQLDRQISVLYYERLLSSQEKESVTLEAKEKMAGLETKQFIHDPYVLEFLNLKDYPALHESTIEQALIDNLQHFLLELGTGFCFESRQKLMRYEDDDFYVDLVFYHSVLKCHVLIDLKLGKLTHGDVGQMDSYIRMFDAQYKRDDDNPTIGIILCSEKNEAVVKYSVLADAKQIFASKYELALPKPEELEKQIKMDRLLIEEQMKKDGDE